MSPPPPRLSIFHITHVDNVADIVADGALYSDAAMNARGGPRGAIGMSNLKAKRLVRPVSCHLGDHVGDYVPFYFCPRSIMLYVLHCANHPELAYRGGQGPIVHLEADLHEVVRWANGTQRRWAFSLSNAGAAYAEFRKDLADLDHVDWEAVAETKWSAPAVKESKQAEFLLHERFPWELVSRIGVATPAMRSAVAALIAKGTHRPRVDVRKDWYY